MREDPYIVRLELDNKNHLIIHKSDGDVVDEGYLPTEGISIFLKEGKKHERHK